MTDLPSTELPPTELPPIPTSWSRPAGPRPPFRAVPLRQGARRLVAPRRLLEVGGNHRVGLDADLRQQRQTARRAGSQHKVGALGVGHAALLMHEASMAFRAYLKR